MTKWTWKDQKHWIIKKKKVRIFVEIFGNFQILFRILLNCQLFNNVTHLFYLITNNELKINHFDKIRETQIEIMTKTANSELHNFVLNMKQNAREQDWNVLT